MVVLLVGHDQSAERQLIHHYWVHHHDLLSQYGVGLPENANDKINTTMYKLTEYRSVKYHVSFC